MPIKTAEDLFLSELKDIYSAEKQATKAYPRLAKAVSTPELKNALQQHLEQTRQQIERLDRVFEVLDKRSGGKTCEAMKGLLEEGAEHMEEIEQGPILDAALIAALQRIEHYEIAAYGTVASFAEAMGQTEIQQLLAETLQEEKQTDEKLTELSKAVNQAAIGGEEEDEDEEDDLDEEDDEDLDDEDLDDDDLDDDEDDEDEEDEEEVKLAAKKAAKKSAKSARK